MSATTIHSTRHPQVSTTKAQFLAPGTHPRAVGNQDQQQGDMTALLQEVLTRPGVVNAAYRAFHNYSLGNQMLAAVQLSIKGLPLSPIASFNAWREKGRFVKKGEKAISLFMPISVKRRAAKDATAADAESGEGRSYSVYMLRPNWFSLEQTEGEEFAPELVVPQWDAALAMAALDITEEPFEQLLGNRMGYALGRTIGISPLNPLKHKTRFHEMAHVVLGHTTEGDMSDGPETARHIVEAEAEGVAYILCALLDLPGQAESRYFVQRWLDGRELPEKSAKKIFGAADRIMKAGQPVTQ